MVLQHIFLQGLAFFCWAFWAFILQAAIQLKSWVPKTPNAWGRQRGGALGGLGGLGNRFAIAAKLYIYTIFHF
jgi:hypothetical protein